MFVSAKSLSIIWKLERGFFWEFGPDQHVMQARSGFSSALCGVALERVALGEVLS